MGLVFSFFSFHFIFSLSLRFRYGFILKSNELNDGFVSSFFFLFIYFLFIYFFQRWICFFKYNELKGGFLWFVEGGGRKRLSHRRLKLLVPLGKLFFSLFFIPLLISSTVKNLGFGQT
jgi:hypothetical protein